MSRSRSQPGRKRKSKSRVIKKSRFLDREYFLFVLKKTGLFLVFIIFFMWLGAWFFLSNTANDTQQWLHQKMIASSQSMGFNLENLNVQGRYFADPEAIIDAVGLQKGDPIFSLKTEEAYDSLENLEWIEWVSIKRILPNTVFVRIQESVPLALYKTGKELSLIGAKGEFITKSNLKDFRDLVIVEGDNADQQAPILVKDLRAVEDIFSLVETAQYVSDRRWNLFLSNSVQVKLPEYDVPLALSTLSKMQKDDKIFEKMISIIDMRDLSRIIVQSKNGDRIEANRNSGNTGDLI